MKKLITIIFFLSISIQAIIVTGNGELRIDEEYVSMIMNKYNISRESVLRQAKKILEQNIYLKQKILPILSIFISKDNEYIAWTKEGFFTASKGGAKYIGYYINQGANKEARFVSVDKLHDTFYRPDLIAKALNGENLSKFTKNIDIIKILNSILTHEIKN